MRGFVSPNVMFRLVSPKKSYVSPKIQNTFFSPTLRQSEFVSFQVRQCESRKHFDSPNLKSTSSFTNKNKARRHSEFKKHVFGPNLKSTASLRNQIQIRTDDVFLQFGLTMCFLNSDWRRAFQIRTDNGFFLSNSDWRLVGVKKWIFGLKTVRSEDVSDWNNVVNFNLIFNSTIH